MICTPYGINTCRAFITAKVKRPGLYPPEKASFEARSSGLGKLIRVYLTTDINDALPYDGITLVNTIVRRSMPLTKTPTATIRIG